MSDHPAVEGPKVAGQTMFGPHQLIDFDALLRGGNQLNRQPIKRGDPPDKLRQTACLWVASLKTVICPNYPQERRY